MRMCGMGAIATVALVAMFVGGWISLAQAMNAAYPVPEREYKIVAVFSADYCAPCKGLERWLKKHSYTVHIKEVTTQPAVQSFPTVFYQNRSGDLSWDNGQRIYNWETALPTSPVEIILWRTKE